MAAVDINAKYAALAGEVNDSKKDMIYATDDGTEYIVNISENIGEVMGFDDVVSQSSLVVGKCVIFALLMRLAMSRVPIP